MADQKFLTKDQELELGRQIQSMIAAKEKLGENKIPAAKKAELESIVSRGELAVEELVRSNIGLVYDRARHFKSRFPGAPDLEDLVQEGMTGLMTAVYKYDPTMGNKFSTVAFQWIRQSIVRGVNNTHRMVRLPENRIADYSLITKTMNKHQEDGLTPLEMDQKIREETGLTQSQLVNIRNAANWHTSLNRKVGSDDSSKELIDIVSENTAGTSAEFSVTTNECFRILSGSISGLSEIKKEVLASHFSIELDGEYLDSNQVKEHHGLSPSKYRRLLAEGLKDLKLALADKDLGLEDFIEV